MLVRQACHPIGQSNVVCWAVRSWWVYVKQVTAERETLLIQLFLGRLLWRCHYIWALELFLESSKGRLHISSFCWRCCWHKRLFTRLNLKREVIAFLLATHTFVTSAVGTVYLQNVTTQQVVLRLEELQLRCPTLVVSSRWYHLTRRLRLIHLWLSRGGKDAAHSGVMSYLVEVVVADYREPWWRHAVTLEEIPLIEDLFISNALLLRLWSNHVLLFLY